MSNTEKNDFLHTREELKELQALPLKNKIQISHTRLLEWYKVNNNKCYVSFSGGIDSTVLAYLTAQVCSILNCKLTLWFSDTGLEFPEIREFVKSYDIYLKEKFPTIEIETIIDQPKYSRKTGKHKKGERVLFKDVILEHGYPIISKNIAGQVSIAKRNPNGKVAQYFNPESELYRGKGSFFKCDQWAYLIKAPFNVSNYCCMKLKETPSKNFHKKTGLYPIIGTMANEGIMRTNKWLQYGCNAFNIKNPHSLPLSIWTKQDILEFIKEYDLPYCSVYGEIVKNDGESGTLLDTIGLDVYSAGLVAI